jgi:ArsR family transcriptional regulator
MRNLINIFKALSDETRVRILKLLEGGELCICKIMDVVDMKQSRVSRHMGILKNARLVKDRRDGKWVHYSLNPKPEDFSHKEIISLLEKCLKDYAVVARDREELRKLLEKEKKGLWRPGSTCGVKTRGQGARVKGSRIRQQVIGSRQQRL